MNSVKKESVLIVGCGWVGKKLGRALNKQGYTVYGTTRSISNFSSLEIHGIQPVQFELPVQDISTIDLPPVNSVVISTSPGRGGDRSDYPTSIKQLAQLWVDSNAQVIMYSSTSAYENALGEVREHHTSPEKNSTNALIAAEGELKNALPNSVILRLSGLYGEDRHPVKYLSGRKNIKDGDAPVNLVHRDDVIGVTTLVIEKDIRNEIFNVCSPEHPKKKKIYTTIAKRLEMEEPHFCDGGADGKKVSPQKLIHQYGYSYLHPDPMNYRNN